MCEGSPVPHNNEQTKPEMFTTVDELMKSLKRYGGKSTVAREVATYIEKHYTDVVFMTATQVAEAAGVSQGSVSRFCSAMGFNGFNAFQHRLRHIDMAGKTAPERISYAAGHNRDITDSHERAIAVDISNITKLRQVLSDEQYPEFVKAIATARRLVLISARISATVLPYFAYTLNKMRPRVDFIQPGCQEWQLLSMDDPEGTVVLTTVFPRYSKDLIDKLGELKDRGFRILALTDSLLSPVAEIADITLSLPVVAASTFDNYAALTSFFSIVLEDAAPQIPHVAERIKSIEDAELAAGVYCE